MLVSVLGLVFVLVLGPGLRLGLGLGLGLEVGLGVGVGFVTAGRLEGGSARSAEERLWQYCRWPFNTTILDAKATEATGRNWLGLGLGLGLG